jgi:hypothetical protein
MIPSDDIVPRVRRTQEKRVRDLHEDIRHLRQQMMPHSSNLQGCGAAGVYSGRAGTRVACLTWDARLRPWRSARHVCWRVTSATPQADQHIIPFDQQLELLDFHVSASPCCPRALFPSHHWPPATPWKRNTILDSVRPPPAKHSIPGIVLDYSVPSSSEVGLW